MRQVKRRESNLTAGYRKPTNEVQASLIADELPVCEDLDDEFGMESDLISLRDIVVTAIDTGIDSHHWWIHKYDPRADGVINGWAVLAPLPSAGDFKPDGRHIRPVELYAPTVREGVYLYLLDRLNKGMDLSEARRMVDGSYTDVVVADSIIQFVLYGQEVFS